MYDYGGGAVRGFVNARLKITDPPPPMIIRQDSICLNNNFLVLHFFVTFCFSGFNMQIISFFFLRWAKL